MSGSLPFGADAVCTYVNTKDPSPAYLFVLKNTDPPNDPEQFSFNAKDKDDPSRFNADFSLAGGDYQGFKVQPGTAPGREYTVTEMGKPGWQLTELDCVTNQNSSPIVGDPQTGEVTVRLVAGEVAVCVFENQKLATLSVDKVTDVTSPQVFPFTASSTPDPLTPASFSLTGGGAPRVYTDIPAGNKITITEQVPTAAPDRWRLTGIACDGTQNPQYDLGQGKAEFTIAAGEDVDCTYTDAKVLPATVQIVKQADPADGTEFDFTASGAKGGV